MRIPDKEDLLEELEQGKYTVKKIKSSIGVKDFLLVSLPLALAIFFQLQPESFQQRFILNYSNLKFPNIFTQAYVHKDLSHFLNNIGMYLVVTAFIYPLSILGNYKKEITQSLLAIFLFLPVISALINAPQLSSMIQTTQGLSGIVAGLIGLLPFPLIAYLRKNTENIDFDYVSLIFLLGAFSLILSASRYSLQNLKFAPLLFLIGILASYYYKWSFRHLKEAVRTIYDSPTIEFTLVITSFVIFLIAPFLLLEVNIDGETMSNIWGHMTGYVLGFVITSSISTIHEYREKD